MAMVRFAAICGQWITEHDDSKCAHEKWDAEVA